METSLPKLFTGCVSAGCKIMGLATPLDYLTSGIYNMPKIIFTLDKEVGDAFAGFMLISGTACPYPILLEPKKEGFYQLPDRCAIADIGFLFYPDGKIEYRYNDWNDGKYIKLISP